MNSDITRIGANSPIAESGFELVKAFLKKYEKPAKIIGYFGVGILFFYAGIDTVIN